MTNRSEWMKRKKAGQCAFVYYCDWMGTYVCTYVVDHLSLFHVSDNIKRKLTRTRYDSIQSQYVEKGMKKISTLIYDKFISIWLITHETETHQRTHARITSTHRPTGKKIMKKTPPIQLVTHTHTNHRVLYVWRATYYSMEKKKRTYTN